MAMKTREELQKAGEKVLTLTRTELYLSLPFMAPALDRLAWTMDLSTLTFGTDAEAIRYNPIALCRTWVDDPRYVSRAFLHMLFHCLFLHMYHIDDHEDRVLWDLASDMAVEAVIDSLKGCPAVEWTLTDLRAAWYEKLRNECGVLTAERIYRSLAADPPDPLTEEKLRAEFTVCDHAFWDEMNKEKPADPPPEGGAGPDYEKSWDEAASRLMSELDSFGREGGTETGNLRRILAVGQRRRLTYGDFLRRYAVVREEARVDLDSFDYGFYNYGMTLYGNMPLIEENEYRESKKVEQLVIAVDTSASCQKTLVSRFLSETAAVIASRETFFHHVDLRIIECDDRIQKELVIHSPEEMERYLDAFEVHGGFGTDFRPVFDYVAGLRARGNLKNLRGLLYFTDGFGRFPVQPTDYETVFIFLKDDLFDLRKAPKWAVTLTIDDDTDGRLILNAGR